MTSTYLMSSSSMMNRGLNFNNSNAHTYSNYGLSYFNESSASEYSDGYQSSVSPDLSSCFIKSSSHTPTTTSAHHQKEAPYYYHHHQNYQQPNTIKPSAHIGNENFTNFNDNFNSLNFYEMKTLEKYQKPTHLQNFPMKKKTLSAAQKCMLNDKQIIVAPEVMKKRRVAANARERRRMNNLNFAFDK